MIKSFAALLISAFLFVTLATPLQAHHLLLHEGSSEPSDMGFMKTVRLISSIGAFKTARLLMSPKDERGAQYHAFAEEIEKGCELPNAWYIHDGTPEFCAQLIQGGLNIVCGQTCPENRQTGAACGLGHQCCRPPGFPEEPLPIPVSKDTRCDPGSTGTIQYCNLGF